jgi:hypothetical protein
MKIIAAVFILCAVAVAVVPQYTNCAVGAKAGGLAVENISTMKCHWTAMAEPAVGIPLLLVGVLLLFSANRETRRALSIVGLALGGFAVLLPAWLIGVCDSDMMLCKIAMKPALIYAGTITIAAGIAGAVLAGRSQSARSSEAGRQ